MITDKQRLDFLELIVNDGGIVVEYDEGPTIWADSTCTKEDPDSKSFKDTPIQMFTVRTQHIRGKSLRELIDRAILSKPKRI